MNGEPGLKTARRSIAIKQSIGAVLKELFGVIILKATVIAMWALDFSEKWSKIGLYNVVQPSHNKVV